jgi:predicted esterase
MKKLLFGLGLLIPFLLSAQQVPRSLTAANGTFIGFYEYKPPMYSSNPTGKFPLIIFLHGIGERGDGSSTLSSVLNVGIPRNIHYGLTDMQFNYNGTTQGFLVLSPQLSYNYGNWQPFYIQEMIKYAKNNLRVDTNRIYLTGLSLGGGGVWNYASSSSSAARGLAAIAPICGTCDWSGLNNIAQQALPVWAFHAMDDGVVGVGCTQSAINGINSYNPIVPPQATYYPTGNHWIWDQVYDPANPQLYLWFLSKSRGSSTPPPPTGGNVAPVANAGNAQTITLPTNSVSLSGSGSYDSDGTITSYVWSQAGGPGNASFTNANAANTSVGGLVQGTYTFKLTVTDNVGSTNSANVNVTVNAAAAPSNTPPVAVTSGNQTITLPNNSAFLLGSGSYDQGGYITNYAWSQESGPSTASITQMNSNLDVKNMVAGTYVFKLTVTDNGGATNSATATITVTGTATPPPTGGGGGGTAGAPFAVTSGNQTITLPTNSAFLLGSGSYDVGGYITNYAWSQSSGPNTATITPMGANLDVKNMIAGTYVFKLTVTDNSGLTGSANVTITVNGTSTPPPTGGGGTAGAPFAVTSANQTITLPANSVFLLGSGSYDVGGWITNYAWSQSSGPNTATITPMGSNLDVKNMIAGTYVFKLTVTDNSGLTGSDDVTITVNSGTAAPPPSGGAGSPTAVAGANQYITLPVNSVYLMGGGSFDVGGWITNFAWSQESGPSNATLTQINPSNVEARNLIAGTYTFKLTVTDNSGLTGTSTMQVFVYGSSARTASTTTTEVTSSPIISNAVSTTATPTTTLVKTAAANSLTLYPNPVITTLNVELNNDITGEITINIINAAGSVVKSIKATKSSYSFTQQVSMQDLKSGTYVVEIRYSDGSSQSRQVIKQ